MNTVTSLSALLVALVLSPLLRSVINRTKAWFAGRQGSPLLQPYWDLLKLLRKGAVYGTRAGWMFRAGPVVGLVTTLGALCILPVGGGQGLLHFEGDLLVFVYLLAVGRFFTILAAMDTGSSFEGMGASREAFFAALTEAVLMLGLGGLAMTAHSISLSGIYASDAIGLTGPTVPALVFVIAAFLIVFLAENSRIPIDDPTTHLELTMIHEVMVLDHCGVDLAFIEYTRALKLWVFGALIAGLVVRTGGHPGSLSVLLTFMGVAVIAVITGVIESVMARLKLIRVPQLLMTAFVLAALWTIWIVI